MVNERVTLLVSSCDKYSSTWEPFFKLLKIQWPECLCRIVLSTETKQFHMDSMNINTINAGPGLSWSTRLIRTLNQINTEYILFFLEDFFLLESVDNNNFNKAVKILDDNSNVCMIQFPSIEKNYKRPEVIFQKCYKKVSLFEPYRAKVMVWC